MAVIVQNNKTDTHINRKVCFALVTMMFILMASLIVIADPSESDEVGEQYTEVIDFDTFTPEQIKEALETNNDGTATYDSEKKKLTIENIDFVTEANKSINCSHDLEIEVKGINTITALNNDGRVSSYGIYMNGDGINLKITGNGSLEIQSGDVSKEKGYTPLGRNSVGVYCCGNESDATTTIEGDVTLIASGGDAMTSIGIKTDKLVIFGSGTNVFGCGHDIDMDSYPLKAYDAIGSYGVYCKSLILTDTNLTAYGGEINGTNMGFLIESIGLMIESEGECTIEKTSVDVRGSNVPLGGSTESLSCGMELFKWDIDDKATITNSKMTMMGNNGDLSYGIESFCILEISSSVLNTIGGDRAIQCDKDDIRLGKDFSNLEGKRTIDGSFEPVTSENIGEMIVIGTIHYTVTYELAGGSGFAPVQESVAVYDSFKVADYDGTKSGCTFMGWSDGNKTYQPGEKYVMGNTPVTLTAVWESNGGNANVDYTPAFVVGLITVLLVLIGGVCFYYDNSKNGPRQ